MQKLNKEIFSVLDANFDRLSEGVRVLEDVSRFILKDSELTQKLKNMRHSLISEGNSFQLGMLNSRGKDVGEPIIVSGERKRQKFTDLVIANAKRSQEASRVLEEYFKFLKEPGWIKFKEGRFSFYKIEKEIVSKLLRQEKIKKIFPLYVVFDTQYLRKRDPAKLLKEIIKGGVKAIQLRAKEMKFREFIKLAQKLKKICLASDVLFIINDYPEVALAVDADGVHLGEDDLPIVSARKLLPFDKIIGFSVHKPTEAIKAEKSGADYLSVGSIFPTSTKKDAVLVGPSAIKKIKKKISLPLIAIGGINENNLGEVLQSGADGIALVKAVLDNSNPRNAVKRILNKVEKFSKKC